MRFVRLFARECESLGVYVGDGWGAVAGDFASHTLHLTVTSASRRLSLKRLATS